MKQFLRNMLVGDAQICEYATVTIPDAKLEKVFLDIDNTIVNVTHIQWVFCLNPIVFGIWIQATELATLINSSRSLKIYFCNSDDSLRIKNPVAIGALKVFDKIEEPGGTFFLFRLMTSRLYHANFLKIAILFHRYYKKPALTFKMFKSLVTAYSFPRKVRIVSFRQEDFYNVFPMDLLGDIASGNRYVFGLRHTNITLQKIIQAGKVTVCEIPFAYKKIIYELGKHHGSSPPEISSLPFKTIAGRQFGFYIPEWAESYKEVEIIRTINLGSHMLLWGKVINRETLNPPSGNLFHIHFLEYLNQLSSGRSYPLV